MAEQFVTRHETDNAELRKASGEVSYYSKLVSFLYDLMRDHMPPGEVESLMRSAQDPQVKYTNGWLANYAEYLARRLTADRSHLLAWWEELYDVLELSGEGRHPVSAIEAVKALTEKNP